jgi:Leucine Rich Repeat (LRR) protein
MEVIAMTDSEGAEVARKGKRRWWQFSLASLLLLMTALALSLGFWTDSARRQERMVQWVEEREGTVVYGYEDLFSGKGDPPGPAWLRNWLGIDYLDYVQAVKIENESVTDADLAAFSKDLPRLKYFMIGHAPNVTDAGIAHLASLHDLEHLRLDCPEMTDAGMTILRSLPLVEHLDVKSNHVTNAGLVHLGSLHHLESVDLASDNITDDGLVYLRSLSKLWGLTLRCPITDAGMEYLIDLTGLTNLRCLGAPSDTERRRLASVLSENSTADFIDEPLSGVCDYYTDYHAVKFRIDDEALAAAQLDRSTWITAQADGVPLKETLDLILHPNGFGWYLGEGEIVITTAEIDAEKHAGINKLRQGLSRRSRVTICW